MATLVATWLAAPCATLRAQAADSAPPSIGPLGPNADAYTLPRGGFRMTLTGDHAMNRGRFRDGQAEPLGGAFNTAQLGATHLRGLAVLNTAFSAMGVSGLNASLGATRLELRQRTMTTQLGMELGVFDWLTLGVQVPFVRTRSEALLRLDGSQATAGVNPYYLGSGVPAANTALINAYDAAVQALDARRTDCEADVSSHPECGAILSQAGEVAALLNSGTQFVTGLRVAYGANASPPPLRFVPLVGSPGDVELRARAAALADAFAAYGVTNVTSTTGIPLGAQTPLTAEQLAQLIDTAYAADGGFEARPMSRRHFQQIGDVDVTAKLRLYDGLRDTTRLPVRQSVMLTYRIGSGYADDPDDFIDLGTGSGVNALGVRSLTDVRLFRRITGTITLGWAQAATHTRQLRVPSAAYVGWVAPPLYDVRITPTAVLEAGVAGRVQWTDGFTVGAGWRWRGKGEDAHEIVGGVIQPPTSALDTESAWDEHRFAGTLSYATPAALRGVRGMPVEIGFTHEQVIGNSRGAVPQTYTDRLQLRYYTRFFGAR